LFQAANLLSVIITFLMIAACSDPATPEQQVAERALERWQAIIDNDLESAYAFLSPAYRQAVPLTMYQGRLGQNVAWRDAEVKSVSCATDACDVALQISYRYNMPNFEKLENSRLFKEKWIRIEDDWWYFEKS
jgi:hypothetical protein